MYYTATYSPEDNKLRLYATSRLDAETYARVKAAGFSWAPKQELFYAPAWTPDREDLLIELAGEIGDEDTSLVERADARAERFEDYRESRVADAEQARQHVASIADGIPMGQPILVGHHSERHARRDAEKIENGMRRAVKMWETANYWKQRAAGAIAHAKYKELPAVRARRIKTLEADKRKQERNLADMDNRVKLWSKPMNLEQAQFLAGHTHTTSMEIYFALNKGEMTAEQAAEKVITGATAYKGSCERWIAHLSDRLEYERAMLGEAGGIVADRNKPEKGGAVRCWASPGYGRGWSYIQKVNKVSVTVLDNFSNSGRNFKRTIPFDKLKAVMSAQAVQDARDTGQLAEDRAGEPTGFFLRSDAPEERKVKAPEATDAEFDAIKDSLKAGVQVVSAPQLFPTPADIADRMVELADLQPGQDILEPSAGTGAIVDAIRRVPNHGCAIVAVEINQVLAHRLAFHDALGSDRVHQADFLECNGSLGQFERIIMNPPFENGADIRHIEHALTFLKPGGLLVALCANGPRQNEKLKPQVDAQGGQWDELPAGTFSGTNVRAVLLTLRRP